MLDKDCSPVLRESWPDAWSGSRGSNGGVETRRAVLRGYQAQPHSGYWWAGRRRIFLAVAITTCWHAGP